MAHPSAAASWREFADALPDTLLVLSADGAVRHVGAPAHALLGADPADLRGRHLGDLVHPDDRSRALRLLASCLSDPGSCQVLIVRFRHADRTWVECEAAMASAGSARAAGECLWVLRASGKRSAAEREAREREQLFRTIMEALPEGVILVDDTRCVREANAEARQILGLPPEAMGGVFLDPLFPVDAGLASGWEAFIVEGAFRGRVRIDLPEGPRLMDVAARAHVLPGRHLALFRDVTERTELDRQLRQEARLAVATRVGGGIADSLDHLVTSLFESCERLEAHLPDESAARDDADRIRRSAAGAATLARQLKAFSQRLALQPARVNLHHALSALEPMLRQLAGSSIAVELRAGDGPLAAWVDPAQFDQVILSVVRRAIGMMPDGGRLTIEAGTHDLPGTAGVASGSQVLVEITDRGPTLSASARDSAFLPFSEPGEPGDLGLSVAWGIVQQSGGNLSINPVPGGGTCVGILVPAAPADIPGRTSGEVQPGERLARILLVEDDPAVRRVTERILRNRGYSVVTAASGTEALRVADDMVEGMDLLLTDVMMPGISGADLASQLRQERPTLRVLFMSGYINIPALERDVIQENLLLVKPFTPSELLDHVRQALGIRETT